MTTLHWNRYSFTFKGEVEVIRHIYQDNKFDCYCLKIKLYPFHYYPTLSNTSVS